MQKQKWKRPQWEGSFNVLKGYNNKPKNCTQAKISLETSLVAQGLRLCPSNAGDMGLNPSWGTKIPHAVAGWPQNNNTNNNNL